MSAAYAGKHRRSRERLRTLIADAQRPGHLRPGDPDRLAEGALSFTLGLVVQALFDPGAFPPGRQIELLDEHLGLL